MGMLSSGGELSAGVIQPSLYHKSQVRLGLWDSRTKVPEKRLKVLGTSVVGLYKLESVYALETIVLRKYLSHLYRAC